MGLNKVFTNSSVSWLLEVNNEHFLYKEEQLQLILQSFNPDGGEVLNLKSENILAGLHSFEWLLEGKDLIFGFRVMVRVRVCVFVLSADLCEVLDQSAAVHLAFIEAGRYDEDGVGSGCRHLLRELHRGSGG